MLGWVITCHDDRAEALLERLQKRHGPQAQCRAVNFWCGLSANMLSRMLCDALHETNSGDGVIFLTDTTGATPWRVASLQSHKHPQCEVISGISYSLLEEMLPWRKSMSSEAFRERIVTLGAPETTSLWHQQQKHPPFVLLHDRHE
ncbi:PTS sugar transporter subunit IIA [Intestinirhabdus alba]|jgi:mannose/fructose-specific phosphotransferase system component IIA|uniref:PTS sugar transporter subunit IIA n=1 Tax=Intestinirhabdus alba TaxID=2899544 RepID=A0A6L6IEI1_9ENTR|nr:PTS sugar transporter subunit IIA [Intestinirhabdus alba]MTH45151.1 PTS sugar transporter subunit IIA [Intestinirhabdus alba]